MCLNIGTPQNHHFPSETIGEVVELGVPILKHFRVNGWLLPSENFNKNGSYDI